MKEPVDHIERPSLPWRREGSATECGLDASKTKWRRANLAVKYGFRE